MRRLLLTLGLAVMLAVIGTWAVTGTNLGWTKTSEAVKFLDEVTGNEGITYEKRFRPGLDFLGAGLLGGGILMGIALLFKSQRSIQSRNL